MDELASAAAVAALQTQLDRHLSAVDGMDQKAALLPPLVGAVGVLGLVPAHATGLALWLDAAGVAAGLFAIAACFVSLAVRTVPVGGNEDQIASGAKMALDDFNAKLARSLADAIGLIHGTEKRKARSLNVAFFATAVAIGLWVVAHAIGQ